LLWLSYGEIIVASKTLSGQKAYCITLQYSLKLMLLFTAMNDNNNITGLHKCFNGATAKVIYA
jgi:hypothetical protein